jgi:hypothetical protein
MQEECEFKASLGYIVRFYLKKGSEERRKEEKKRP